MCSCAREPMTTNERRPRIQALALMLICALPTVWMGSRRTRLEVDTQNRSLKSIDTRESRDVERLISVFGSDQSILLGFQTAHGVAMSPAEAAHVEGIAKAIARVAGVRSVSSVERPDGGLACFSVTLPTSHDGFDPHDVAERVLAQAADRCSSKVTMHATGQPLFESAIAREVDGERRAVVPFIVATLLLLLWVSYRSFVTALLILIPAGFGILWTGGTLQLLGHRLNPLLVLLDPLLLTVGVAVSVHIVEAFRRHRSVHGYARSAEAVRRGLWRPMLLTTITSMVGFLSLSLSPIPAVKTLGVFAAFGVALTSCFAIWTVPIWLAAFAPAALRTNRDRNALAHYVAWLHTRAGRVLIVAAVVLSALLSHASHVRIDNDPMRILAAGSSIRKSTDWMVDRLGGVESFGLLIPHKTVAAQPEMASILAAELHTQPAIASLAGPPMRAENGDVLLRAALRPSGSHVRELLFDGLEQFTADVGMPEIHAVGTVVQVARDSGSLIRSQLWGLALVIPLLGLAVAIGLQSWRLGLISLIPNALPGILLHGAMAALDRTLSVATVMIGAVMMGLIVDDTIHLLHHYRESTMRGHSRRIAVREALRKTGRPITITSIVLFVGFAVGAFGSLTTTIEFSVLAASTVALAWVLDVLILPAMLLVRRPRRRETPRPVTPEGTP
jgi:uncharacterized protein